MKYRSPTCSVPLRLLGYSGFQLCQRDWQMYPLICAASTTYFCPTCLFKRIPIPHRPPPIQKILTSSYDLSFRYSHMHHPPYNLFLSSHNRQSARHSLPESSVHHSPSSDDSPSTDSTLFFPLRKDSLSWNTSTLTEIATLPVCSRCGL